VRGSGEHFEDGPFDAIHAFARVVERDIERGAQPDRAIAARQKQQELLLARNAHDLVARMSVRDVERDQEAGAAGVVDLRAALCERLRALEDGRYPASLAGLPGAEGPDPFTGAPLAYRVLTDGSATFEAPGVPIDARQYETKRLFAVSKDGTRVPFFITAPGQTDGLFNAMVVFLIVVVFSVGLLYLRLHALPEHLAHGTSKVQLQLVGVLALLALFTHNHIFWIAALLLALVQFPDFSSPLASMARSLEKLAGLAPPAEALVSSPATERAPQEPVAARTAPLPASEPAPGVPEKVT